MEKIFHIHELKYIIFKIIILLNEIYEIYRFSAVTRKYQKQFCRYEKHQLQELCGNMRALNSQTILLKDIGGLKHLEFNYCKITSIKSVILV